MIDTTRMESVYLVGTHLKKSKMTPSESNDSLDELSRLVNTAGGIVAGKTLQVLESPSPATFIGKGKVSELRAKAIKKEFKTLVFDDELKPVQLKNIAELIPVKILDRTRLILDIFAKRARTREGILQVELAQLSYMLPRMTERYGRFEQQVGGIGTRGPGERKLEVEARQIRDRTAQLKKEINTISYHREIARERRHAVPLPVIAMVGYTNAGKSTLLNTLVQLYGQKGEEVYTDDKLFATLDPTTRRIRLPSGRWALFTDTVGFINKLPTHLIAAFKSTLEETLNADLLIHLIDPSDINLNQHAKTVMNILESLQGDSNQNKKNILQVYNKCDLLSDDEKSRILSSGKTFLGTNMNQNIHVESLCISASKNIGMNDLLKKIDAVLSENMIETTIYVPFKKSGVLQQLYRLCQVQRVSHVQRGVRLHVKLDKSQWNKIQKQLK